MVRCKRCLNEWCSQDFDHMKIKCPSCGSETHNTNVGIAEEVIIAITPKKEIVELSFASCSINQECKTAT
jgi:PHP family Zn ribbon phosphoesterase